jgi:hypothetical protein
VSDDDTDRLVALIGRVTQPTPSALNGAREMLWSAVATDMLATDPNGEATQKKTRDAEQRRDSSRRRATDPDS